MGLVLAMMLALAPDQDVDVDLVTAIASVASRRPLPGMSSAETAAWLVVTAHTESRMGHVLVGDAAHGGACGPYHRLVGWGPYCNALIRDFQLATDLARDDLAYSFGKCGTAAQYISGRCDYATGQARHRAFLVRRLVSVTVGAAS